MSSYIQIEKTVDIEVTVSEVVCDCGESLEYSVSADGWGDIKVSVEEHVCTQQEEEE